MQKDRDERPGLLWLHQDPRDNDKRDDRHALARRSCPGTTQHLGGERQGKDEEGRPEIAERREISHGRQRESVPRAFVRTVTARRDARRYRDQHRTGRERERKPIRPEERGELRRSRSRDV